MPSSKPKEPNAKAITGKLQNSDMEKFVIWKNKSKCFNKSCIERQGGRAMIKEEVDAEDIADVVSRWTGIPVSK